MSGGQPLLNKPNGTFTAYYGDASSCIKHLLDKQDWVESMKRPDAAKWSMSPQSGTVLLGAGFDTVKNGAYRGWE